MLWTFILDGSRVILYLYKCSFLEIIWWTLPVVCIIIFLFWIKFSQHKDCSVLNLLLNPRYALFLIIFFASAVAFNSTIERLWFLFSISKYISRLFALCKDETNKSNKLKVVFIISCRWATVCIWFCRCKVSRRIATWICYGSFW